MIIPNNSTEILISPDDKDDKKKNLISKLESLQQFWQSREVITRSISLLSAPTPCFPLALYA